MKPTLVVMAAGMGSRFGGLKQAEPITPSGLGLLDFSVADAKRSGFGKVVFIVREDMQEDFKNLIGNRIEKSIPIEYVIQDTSILPEGRSKPFGTGHAILCCKDVVHENFAIVNADDYYGAHAFIQLEKFLETTTGSHFAMVPYQLGKTLSKNGTVSRGICKLDATNHLLGIEEVTKIDDKGHCVYGGKEQTLPLDTPISMNIWGLTPYIFEILEEQFRFFLSHADLSKDEFYIPKVIGTALEKGLISVQAFPSSDQWYGITYREDLPEVKQALNQMIEDGKYPELK